MDLLAHKGILVYCFEHVELDKTQHTTVESSPKKPTKWPNKPKS